MIRILDLDQRKKDLPSTPWRSATVAAFRLWRGSQFSVIDVRPSGEGGIRTHGTLLRYTRFPIALLRPTRSPLQSGELCPTDF